MSLIGTPPSAPSLASATHPRLPPSVSDHNRQVASEPCSEGDGADVTLDASLSRDPSGRPLKSVEWALAVDSPANSSVLSTLLAAANARVGLK